MKPELERCKALTFDLFGTVLDLGGSLTPFIARFLEQKGSGKDASQVWAQWRHRQRIEQYQDTIIGMGHSGYLETARRAFVYVLRLNGIKSTPAEVDKFMEAWQELSPFPDCMDALERMKSRYKLVALSNGNPWFLDHLVKNRIRFDFDEVISVEVAGAFKPHPGVYRRAAGILKMEVGELLMVSSNSFDVMGARTCGYRGAYVNRYSLPYEDTPYEPDLTVPDFTRLAKALM
ncbi:MAG: haloacid dehalogenase type II [Dehalococcoidia bacterium]